MDRVIPGFFTPLNALFFLLLVPLVLFYFLKLKRPQMDIPSLVLWRQVINDSRVNSPFQRFKRNLLLLLQILLLVLLVTATMQPFIETDVSRIRRLPVLIDNSASMAALDKAGGLSRLDAAKERVRTIIDGLLPNQELCIISFGASARRRSGFMDNKRTLREAIKSIEVEDVTSDIEDVLRMVQALSRTVSIDEVLLLSDGNFPPRADIELSFNLNYQQLPAPGPNLGITSLNATRSLDGGWDVFVLAEASAEATAAAALELSDADGVFATETVFPGPGKAQRVAMKVRGDKPLLVTARLLPDGFDALASDNSAYLELPAQRPLVVYAPLSMASYRHAFSVMEGVSLYPETENDAPLAAYDLVVTDRPADLDLNAGTAFCVGIIPQELRETVNVVEDDGSEVVDWHRNSPLLRHVNLTDLMILGGIHSSADVSEGDYENLGYQVLIHGRTGSLLLEKRDGGGLSYYLLFHSDRSTLPWRVGFPVLLSNLVGLARRGARLSEAHGIRTGVLPPLKVQPDAVYEVKDPDGAHRQEKSSTDGILSGIPAPKVGRYSVKGPGSGTFWVGASLLSTKETSLAAIQDIQFSELSVSAASVPLSAPRVLWFPLGVLAFIVLLVEWWYFQRRLGGYV